MNLVKEGELTPEEAIIRVKAEAKEKELMKKGVQKKGIGGLCLLHALCCALVFSSSLLSHSPLSAFISSWKCGQVANSSSQIPTPTPPPHPLDAPQTAAHQSSQAGALALTHPPNLTPISPHLPTERALCRMASPGRRGGIKKANRGRLSLELMVIGPDKEYSVILLKAHKVYDLDAIEADPYLVVCPPVRPSVRLSVLYIRRHLRNALCPSARPSVCLSVHPSTCVRACAVCVM
jgi:hypothetical protein